MSPDPPRGLSGDRSARRRERAAQQREARRRTARRRRWLRIGAAAAVVVIVAAVTTTLGLSRGGSSHPTPSGNGAPGPEGMRLQTGAQLAGLTNAATGATVDGISCEASEQVDYHIHTHLAIFVDGVPRSVAPGVGIVTPVAQQTAHGAFYGASSCYYWLHVHAQDGVIHIESPTQRTYTLGQFFALWGQPLTASRVGTANGRVTAYVNGKAYAGDPTAIPLGSREDVQLDVGAVVAPQPVDWSASQL